MFGVSLCLGVTTAEHVVYVFLHRMLFPMLACVCVCTLTNTLLKHLLILLQHSGFLGRSL